MNGFANIHWIAAHFDRETNFADQIAGASPDDATAENTVVGFVEQKLGEAFVATIGDSPAGRGPWENCLAVFHPLRLALLFGEPGPSDLRIGIGD